MKQLIILLQKCMKNFNFDDNYDSIPKLNKNQMKIFKITVLVLLMLLVLGMLFG